jgi:hypothetical protein
MGVSQFYAENFVGGSYDYHAPGESAQRCVNLYPEKIESPSGKTAYCLRSVKALRAWRSLPQISGTCRGLHFDEGTERLWAVYDRDVWMLEKNDLVPVKVGQVAAGTGRVSIADNGQQIVFADGSNLWQADVDEPAATIATTWSAISFPTFGGEAIEPKNAVSLGRMFFVDGAAASTGRKGAIFYTQKNSTTFTDVDGVLNYFEAASQPDAIVALACVGARLYSLRSRSYDVYSLGDVEIVSRVESVSAEIGCASKSSVASIGENLFWLGSAAAGHNSVWMVQGASAPARVSTNAIEDKLKGVDLSAAIGYCFAESGHFFYALTIRPGWTWVFDLGTGQWHERADRDWNAGENRSWLPALAVTVWDGLVVFGCENGLKIAEGDVDDDGNPVYRLRVSPVYWSNLVPVVCRDFMLDMEVATTKDLSARPFCMMRVSTDGARTFYDVGWRSIGMVGQFRTEIAWENVGYGRGFVASVAFTEPCDVTIFGARLEIEEGSFR